MRELPQHVLDLMKTIEQGEFAEPALIDALVEIGLDKIADHFRPEFENHESLRISSDSIIIGSCVGIQILRYSLEQLQVELEDPRSPEYIAMINEIVKWRKG